jgi:hypothetical protein
MTLTDDIDQYISYFRVQLAEIVCVPQLLHRKILYVAVLDTLSRAAFQQLQGHHERNVTFLDTCSKWSDKDRVSALQLKLILDNKGMTSGTLYANVSARVSKWVEGNIIRPNREPMIDEVRHLATSAEQPLVTGTRYAELLYTHRNHLVHEFRAPGHDFELSDDPTNPYYYSMAGSPWELVFPRVFMHNLCESSLEGLKEHLIRSNLNPYDAYHFGTLWRRK